MKTFKQLFETGNAAADFKVNKDDDDEGTGEKSSADDEENFKKKHKVDKKKHPVAGDNQFNGTTKKDKTENKADGEKKPLKTYKEMKEDILSEEDEEEEEVEVVEAPAFLKPGKLNLGDGKKITLSSKDAKVLKTTYSKLNPTNKKTFEKELMKNKISFNTMLDFAKQT